MAAIQPINSSSIHKITSGQVVVDLQTAVKELLENSIDAGSTSIEIRFKEFGLKSIELIDNGTGIARTNYTTVALKHHTSKLTKFEDLTSIESYGFRGEALASLCAISESVSIITATSEEVPMGTILVLDKTGALKDYSGKVARQRGTTVSVSGLFKALPVRRAELARNIKREFSKALNLLNAYALYPCVKENGGIRLTVTNQTEAGKKSVQLRTSGSNSVPESIKSIWGPKSTENISPFELLFTVQPPASHLKWNKEAPSLEIRMDGLISTFAHGKGRASNDRQFLYINRRPCNLPKVQKVINEVYKTYNTNQYPFVIANLSLALDAYDINVSPDKRTIFLHNEENLMISLREALESNFASSRSTFAVNSAPNIALSKGTLQSDSSQPDTSLPLFQSSDSEIEGEKLDARHSSPRHRQASNASESDQPPAEPIPKSKSVADSRALSSGDDAEERQTSRPVKRRRVSSSMDSSHILTGNAEVELSSEGTHSTPPSAKGAPAAPKNVVALRSSPSRSNRPLPSVDPPRPKTSITPKFGTGVQLTLTQSLRRFKNNSGVSNEAVMTNDDSEGDPQGEDMSVDEPAPQTFASKFPQSTPHKASRRDGIQSLVPPIACLPSSLPDPNSSPTLANNGSSTSSPLSRSARSSSQPVPLPKASDASATPQAEIIRTSESQHSYAKVDCQRLSLVWRSVPLAKSTGESTRDSSSSASTRLRDAGVSGGSEGQAENALSRSISKGDFRENGMSVVGQFNLGFIIARLHRSQLGSQDETDDLFIIDQHAADEKYNFETLQQTTKIQSQTLLRPRPLGLSASDEIIAVERLDVLRANGFEVSFSEEAPVGKRLHLVAQPQSKATVFDMQDLEELLSLMQDQPIGQMVRCSKARAMFASRACRKSTMVGKPLTKQQMTVIIRQMATLDQPWSCPHGRPTMRHLADLREFTTASVRFKTSRRADWSKFA